MLIILYSACHTGLSRYSKLYSVWSSLVFRETTTTLLRKNEIGVRFNCHARTAVMTALQAIFVGAENFSRLIETVAWKNVLLTTGNLFMQQFLLVVSYDYVVVLNRNLLHDYSVVENVFSVSNMIVSIFLVIPRRQPSQNPSLSLRNPSRTPVLASVYDCSHINITKPTQKPLRSVSTMFLSLSNHSCLPLVFLHGVQCPFLLELRYTAQRLSVSEQTTNALRVRNHSKTLLKPDFLRLKETIYTEMIV